MATREIVAARADGTTIRTNWRSVADDARRLAQALERLGRQARRPGRDPGHEPRPPSDRLVRRGRHGRRPPHHQPAAVRRPARLHRQPCRGPRPALRPRVRAARRAAEAAAGRRSSITSASTTSSTAGLPTRGRRLSLDEGDEREPCGLCYTSGTTGNPKGVLYEHRSTMLHAMSIIAPDIFDLSARSVMLPIVPMFHANSWCIPYAAAIAGLQAGDLRPTISPSACASLFNEEGSPTRPACRPSGWA